MNDEESGGTAGSTPPLLRIVKGNPSPEEVAALVAVVSGMAGAAAEAAQEQSPRSEWSARHRLLRRPHRHGPGAWRASAR